MISEDIQVEKREKKEYPPIPKNIYQAQIFDINLADAKGKYAKPGEKVFVFQFTLLEGTDGNNELRGRNIWHNFVPTYLYIGKNGKNDLYRIIEAVNKKELSFEEEATFDKHYINALIGKQLRISIEPVRSGDKVYDNVVDYFAINSKLPELTAEEKEKSVVKKKKEDKEEVKIESDVEHIDYPDTEDPSTWGNIK